MRKGRIFFEGEALCWSRSGVLFSTVHILSALRKYYQVVLFITSEFRDRIEWLQNQYGLREDEILLLPITRRALLALKLLGLPPPGLKVTDADVIFHTSANAFKDLSRQICICHDFMAVTDPKYFSFRDRLHTNHQIRRLRDGRISLICHSEHVAEQASRVARVDRSRILTVPLGLASRPTQPVHHRRPLLLNRPAEALFVSTYHPRKNFERLITYVRRLNKESGYVLHLTAAGPGLSVKLHGKNDAWIRVRDFVPQDEYPALFQAADVYINPSAAEGFGISNLEAQGYGLPVMCNDIPVFHEILGDSAAYFDAEDYASFSFQVRRILDDLNCRNELISAGFDNVQGPTYLENIKHILIPWLCRQYGDGLATPAATWRPSSKHPGQILRPQP
jgi:glycosyltransferase involved in cell wall biosynthesis